MTLQKMTASTGLAVGLVVAGLSLQAMAGTSVASAGTASADLAVSHTAKPVSAQDRMFMDQAAQINLAEISLGRYMKAHAATTAAKDLGGRYARDHTAAQTSLRALASRLHVTLPATPGAQLEATAARVKAQKGMNRDAAFAKASVSGHERAIATFTKEEDAGSDPVVKAYAAYYLAMLHAHLRLAKHAESVLPVTPTR